METSSHDGTPAISSPPCVAPVVHRAGGDVGQIWPSAGEASAVGAATTPTHPQRIIAQAGSGVSSITNAASASSDSAPPADKTPKKGNPAKRKYPDFSRAHSEDNTLLSGDESGEWEDEVDNIEEKIAAENAMELLAACNLEDAVEEVDELDHLLADIVEGVEGSALTILFW